ncbi:MAG: LytTR family DNA-binding domain-containing protein [Syntrophomonadaceae bacterium]|nr:LytTR family DNA-binding domain-containing protein [Syntrophomonadaceae bacterium]
MFTIAICTGEKVLQGQIINLVDSYIAARRSDRIEVHPIKTPAALLRYLERRGGFDVLILNDAWPEMESARLAEAAQRIRSDCQIVCFTLRAEDDDPAWNGLTPGTLHRLEIPITRTRLNRLLYRVLDRARENRLYLICKTKEGVVEVSHNRIEYCRAENYYTRIHMVDESSLRCRGTLEAFHQRLSMGDNRFLKIGRSYIINQDLIQVIFTMLPRQIIMNSGTLIPIPRRAWKQFQHDYSQRLVDMVTRGDMDALNK